MAPKNLHGWLVAIALGLGPFSTAATAATLQLDLPGELDRQTVSYGCRGDATLAVEYYHLPGTSLAVLPIDGTLRVFVSVMAASGVKYVSGPHVWWTRGNRGDLYDESKPDVERELCRVTR